MKKLSESVWGNLRKKSLGQETRREDINSFQGEAFLNYLGGYYKIVRADVHEAIYLIGDKSIEILVLFTKMSGQYYHRYISLCNPGTDKASVLIQSTFVSSDNYQTDENLRDLLLDNFDINLTGDEYLEVFPKDGSKVTNEFYIEFIDFVLDNANDTHIKVIERR